jgi:hypothetical protein
MTMGRPKAALVLTPEQREQLEGLASSRSLPAGLVTRAKHPGCYTYSVGACTAGTIYGMCGNADTQLIVSAN